MGAVRAGGGRVSLTLTPVVQLTALSIASLACAFDLRTRRIPNWLTFGAAGAALVFHLFATGASGFVQGVGGWATGAALLLVPYALGGMGAGDVKLVAALGAWLGPGDTFWLAMYTSIAGGVLALVVGVSHGYVREAWSNIWLLLTHWRVNGVRPFPELTLATGRGPRLAYAAPILVGTIVTLWLR
jgi:prepilin peptidase CpaA